tara:strand:- start:11253 stop:12215 length:963 start_codon:yes stop_codon:yes gene_type:complete
MEGYHKKSNTMNIDTKLLSKLFNTNRNEINKFCNKLYKNKIRYYELSREERDSIIIKILNRIKQDSQIIASKGRKKKWYDGWKENLDLFKKNSDDKFLLPKFYTARENKYFRLGGEIVRVEDSHFEVKMVNIFRNWYFRKYLRNREIKNIYEFGAGTGHNLIELAKIFPEKKLYGSDFVASAVKLLKIVSKKHNINLQSFLFDMKSPNKKIKLLNGSAIYTSGALEQLSGKIERFVSYILKQKPEVVIHCEPAENFYNQNRLIDYLGFSFQNKRKYTNNLYAHLLKLEKKKKIKILKTLKSPFGSLMLEGYNLIVWKCVK